MATQAERIAELEEQVTSLQAEVTSLKAKAEAPAEQADEAPADASSEALTALQTEVSKQREAIKLLVDCTKTMNENHTEIAEILGLE